jgi:hypothetical protein
MVLLAEDLCIDALGELAQRLLLDVQGQLHLVGRLERVEHGREVHPEFEAADGLAGSVLHGDDPEDRQPGPGDRQPLARHVVPVHGHDHRPEGRQVVPELVRRMQPQEPHRRRRKAYLIGDSEYSCKTLAPTLPKNVHFIGPMPMKAAIYGAVEPKTGRGAPRKKGERLPTPRECADLEEWAWTELKLPLYGHASVRLLYKSETCFWYAVAAERFGTMLITRDPQGRYQDRALFSMDGELAVEQILTLFSYRWSLEAAYRACKQELGIDEPQNGWWRRGRGKASGPKQPGSRPHAWRGRKAVQRTMPLGMLSYGRSESRRSFCASGCNRCAETKPRESRKHGTSCFRQPCRRTRRVACVSVRRFRGRAHGPLRRARRPRPDRSGLDRHHRPLPPSAAARLDRVSGRSFWAFGRWSGTASSAVSFSEGDKAVTLQPDHWFSNGESVMVFLSHDIPASDGSRLRSGGFSCQFWTRAVPAPMDFVQVGQMSTRSSPDQTARKYDGDAALAGAPIFYHNAAACRTHRPRVCRRSGRASGGGVGGQKPLCPGTSAASLRAVAAP